MGINKKKSVDILEKTRALMGMNKAEFATALEMSRQNYNNLLLGQQIEISSLQESALNNVGTWIGNLAVKLLIARGAIVPCACQTEIGDNGPCPKHDLVTTEEKAAKLVKDLRSIYNQEMAS